MWRRGITQPAVLEDCALPVALSSLQYGYTIYSKGATWLKSQEGKITISRHLTNGWYFYLAGAPINLSPIYQIQNCQQLTDLQREPIRAK